MINGMKIILHLIVIVVLFVVYVRYLESRSVFYPARPFFATPAELGLPFEDVYIQTEDNVKIHGWLIKAPTAKSAVIFFHGNAGNIGDRLGKIDLFNKMGLNILIIDYRGYGKSKGSPTEEGVYKDAVAAYDYLLKRDDMKGQKIIGYGASLGGAIAVDLASKRALTCLIVDSTFSSAADMAKRIYPFVPSFLIRTKLDSETKIKGIDIPKLFIHSVDDQMIPIALGRKLYDAASGAKEFIEIRGDHNDGHIYDEDKVREGIKRFLRGQELIQ
ncbi:MAG: alpha/beta hydrolase [Candidatus Omnitrophica bacterium]|nr:alpha/beta hydrolase [Candidatus Omnitrophota bacterium]